MILKNLTLLALVLSTGTISYAQDAYDIDKISPELLKNASVVVRNEEQTLKVKNTSNATYTYKTAITILNQNGEFASGMSEYYDKLSNVYDLKAALYDARGKKIKDYRTSDFKDNSLVSDGTMYDDNRLKHLDFLYNIYPYTIEYSYNKDYKGLLSYPSWYPVSSFGCAVEKSSYTFEIPESLTFKYLKSDGLKTDSAKIKDKKTYTWKCENLTALEYEPMASGLGNVTPWVMVSPNKFEYDNSEGSVENWNILGAWVFKLSSDVQSLPEATKAKVLSLVKDTSNPVERIKILYNFLQSNTRYVGVQLGIGGFKPIAAEKVSNVNYGDCKALSNYMKVLLEIAGIKSNLVILGSGKPSLNANYSSFGQANHMILCVPSEKDTTWLECTSQHMPMGFIGYSNADRTVLMITEEGGKLVKTPVYNPEQNYQKRVTKVLLNEQGTADITIECLYGNAQFEDNIGIMLTDPTEQRKILMDNLGIPNMQLNSVSYLQPDKGRAEISEKINIRSSGLITKGGDKLFVTLNIMNRRESIPAKVDDRKTSFAVPYGFYDTDEIIYDLPKGFKVEFIPKEISIESEFGKYTAKVVAKDNTLIYTRTQKINSKKYPPEKYKDLVDFYKKIYQADKQKTILAKL